jgi:hypothetical protein
MGEEEHFISIKENPLYNYQDVIEKICQRKEPHITKIAKRKPFPEGIYRLQRQLSDKHYKRLDEHVEILNHYKVMWLKMDEQEAKAILGTDKPPIFHTYLSDLRRYWAKGDMAMYNLNYMFVHNIKYIKKPVQTRLL